MNEYLKQAEAFAEKHGVTMTSVYLGHYARFSNYVVANFMITLLRKGKEYRFEYSDSINNSWYYTKNESVFGEKKEGLPPKTNIDKFFSEYSKGITFKTIFKTHKSPNMYDILACLVKSDPGSFENFCSEYGYDTDSRKAEKTYEAVCEEWAGVNRLFGDILDELSEIN